MTGPVDECRLGQLEGDGEEELAQQEHKEGAGRDAGDDQRLEAVGPIDGPEDEIERHHRGRKRDHHGGQDQNEDDIAPWPAQAREAIRADGG